ncbi:hypothetical protein H0O01_02530 [Candidatus Micrarchaeota archaeon]|nr:hypothetical protein [Candidatus Micrarchaeota archaeon]
MAERKEKKYASIFEVKDRLSFKGGPNLSQEIDEIVYGSGDSPRKKKK